MTFDYARSAATAQRLVHKFGAAGTIKRPIQNNGPRFDPGEPTYDEHSCMMVVTRYQNREIDGQRILASDRKALVEPNVGVEPKTSDLLITPDGDTMKIVSVDLLRPATTTVLYVLQVRK